MRKAILLAMAAAIVAMFAIPGSASANWTKHHVALPAGQNVELEITGTDIAFTSNAGGITCHKTISRVDFEGGTTTGRVTTFESELVAPTTTITSNCQGTGPLNGCDVHEALADDLPASPWTIHTVSADTVSVTTTGKITNTLTGFLCPHTSSVTGGTVHLTVPNDGDATNNQTTTTSTATLSGTLVGDIGSAEVTVHVSGEIHVLGTITYGI